MLDTVLRGEVNARGDQKIYVARYQFKNAIIGIETAEKKVYKLKFSWFWWLILAACGVVLTPVFHSNFRKCFLLQNPLGEDFLLSQIGIFEGGMFFGNFRHGEG